MSDQIIGLHHWFDSPPGRYLLAWEQARFDEAVVDIFGYHSLQLGMPLLDGLRANRMPHQWLAMGQEAVEGSIAFVEAGGVDGPLQRRAVDLLTEPVALPFPAASLDLLVLPLLIYVIEMRGGRGWTYFFEVFGKNTLFIYLLSELAVVILVKTKVGGGNGYDWLYAHTLQALAQGDLYSTALAPARGLEGAQLAQAVEVFRHQAVTLAQRDFEAALAQTRQRGLIE
eukprot:gene18143-36937_t